MTFWQLAGLSFTAASYERHGSIDPGLLLGALGCVGSAGVALFYEEPRGGWED